MRTMRMIIICIVRACYHNYKIILISSECNVTSYIWICYKQDTISWLLSLDRISRARIESCRCCISRATSLAYRPLNAAASVRIYIYICNMHICIHMLIVRAVTCIPVSSATKALSLYTCQYVHGVSIEGQQIDSGNAQYWSLYAINVIIW